jgi:hypothetical protein
VLIVGKKSAAKSVGKKLLISSVKFYFLLQVTLKLQLILFTNASIYVAEL